MVDNGLCPLKTGSTRLYVSACDNDATSSKPISTGRDIVDAHTQTNEVSCSVTICGSKCCMGVGSMLKCDQNIIVHTLFNKHQRKYRKRNCRKHKRKINLAALATQIDNLLSAYKCFDFMYNFKCLILSLANKHMIALSIIG